MNQKLILILLLIISVNSFSQDSKLKLEINYPIPIDENFIGRSYDGIIDIGLKYEFKNLDFLNLGASLNTSMLTNNSIVYNPTAFSFIDAKVNSYVIQPRIFTELDLESVEKIHPIIGIGYTFMIFDYPMGSDTLDGYNINLGLSYDIMDRLFAQIQY